MSYITYAWLTAIFYGIGLIVAKLSSKYHVSNPWLFIISEESGNSSQLPLPNGTYLFSLRIYSLHRFA